MDCGVPFCQSKTGCPLGNVIPKWNDLVFNVSFTIFSSIFFSLPGVDIDLERLQTTYNLSPYRVSGKTHWIDCYKQTTSQNLQEEFVLRHAR